MIENGAIFQKNIDFPFTYGPFHIVGCKCVSDIKDDEGILLVPKNLMIIGKDLTYLNKLIQEVKDELSEKEDMSTLFLTLNLFLEKNNKNSFFKPYIDLIFTNRDYFATWNDKNYSELHNLYTAQSIKNLLESIDSIYETLIKCPSFSKMTKEEYSYCYFQVISRQFYLDKNNFTDLHIFSDLLLTHPPVFDAVISVADTHCGRYRCRRHCHQRCCRRGCSLLQSASYYFCDFHHRPCYHTKYRRRHCSKHYWKS